MAALLPRTQATRVVVCGGGWGGLTAAKYLKREAPTLDVVLLERNPIFFSCPMSNKWLVDLLDTSFLTHDYLTPAARHGYRFIQTEIMGIERDRKRVATSHGYLDYDYLILSPGIRNNYGAWFGDDLEAAHHTRIHFPSAYIPSAEHLTLKQKIKSFKGGTLVMTLPPPPHRCPPSPYERACLLAWYFKRNNVPARIVILDPKDGIRPIGPGFKAAFDELYPDIITHVPNARVESMDPYAKHIKTTAGEWEFEDAILMVPHQAGELVWMADLIARGEDGRLLGWADVDPLLLVARNDPDVYVIGDAVGVVSPLFQHYPKSGHVANRLARIVAKSIAARAAGREPDPGLPDNLCFMWVKGDPREAIAVEFEYSMEADLIVQKQIDLNDRSPDLVARDFEWIGGMYQDLFG
jgi:NADPH-dependent 2,4-dienoyl-CoA reductase/sulfur reductase-like enzyme